VYGIEPDPRAAAVARSRGLEVYEGTLEESHLPEDAFDAVTMHHVIEHVSDPIATVRSCRRVLRPGGRLVVVTPNLYSLLHRRFRACWRGLEPPRHLYVFSPEALTRCVQRAGLRVEHRRTSARMARWIWEVSRVIERDGQAPRGDVGRRGLWSRGSGLWAQVKEEIIRWYREVGEEVVVVAVKGPC
jgi:SAM-dependent methyltransferase